MITKKILAVILSFTFVLFLYLPAVVSARGSGLVPCGIDDNNNGKIDTEEQCTVCDLFSGTQGIINFLLQNIAGPLMVLMFAWGGFKWIISGDNPSEIQKGKNAMTKAIIGAVCAFGAWIILDTVLKLLMAGGNSDFGGWGPWNRIPTCG